MNACGQSGNKDDFLLKKLPNKVEELVTGHTDAPVKRQRKKLKITLNANDGYCPKTVVEKNKKF